MHSVSFLTFLMPSPVLTCFDQLSSSQRFEGSDFVVRFCSSLITVL